MGMKKQSLKKQTAVMAACNVGIRGLGFVLRLITARLLGPEAVGVMELAGQAHMLALTPAAAGLPTAVSRMTAQTENKEGVLLAARKMALRLGLLMGGGLLVFAPVIAKLMGDERILPSLLMYAPCVLLIGLSGVYRGYSLGRGNAWPPAFCEMTEQMVRLTVVLGAGVLVSRLTVGWRAAVAAFATVLGEGMGLCLIAMWLRPGKKEKAPVEKQLFRQALPITLNRLSHTLLRTLCSVMIPLRLCAAGLSHAEAISRMGMLNGMVMPMIFLPGIFSGALGTVSTPAVAGCTSCARQRRMTERLLLTAALVGCICAGVLYGFAFWIGERLYGLPEVGNLLQVMSPLAAFLPVQQVLSGIMAGLGLQRKSFYAGLMGAGVTLGLTWLWTKEQGIFGAGYAHMVGHVVTLVVCLISLLMHQKTADA